MNTQTLAYNRARKGHNNIESRIVQALRRFGPMNRHQLVEKVRCSHSGISQPLQNLQQLNRIAIAGTAPGPYGHQNYIYAVAPQQEELC